MENSIGIINKHSKYYWNTIRNRCFSIHYFLRKNKSKKLNNEAENEFVQQANNIVTNTQGDNAAFNFTHVQMQSKYQEKTYQEILSDLQEKKENKQKLKHEKIFVIKKSC